MTTLASLAEDFRETWKPQEASVEFVDHYSIPAFDDGRTPAREAPGAIKSNKRLVTPDAVLLSRLNPITPRVWMPRLDPAVPSVTSTEMLVLRPRPGVDRGFLRYVCSSPYVARSMLERVSGTTGSHQRVSPSDVMSLMVPFPELEEQQAISEVLGAFDARLEHLASLQELGYSLQDALLEGLLAESGEPVTNLGEFITLDKGVSYKGAHVVDDPDALPLINLGNFGRARPPRWDRLKRYDGETKLRHRVGFGDVVVCATDMTHDRVVLGKALVVPEDLRSAAVTHHLYAVRCDEDALISPWFVALALNHERIRREVASYANGTTVLSLPRDAIFRVKVPIPDRDRLATFDETVRTLHQLVEHARWESRRLAGLRDALLPALLTGQVRVEDPSSLLGGAA